MEDVLDAGVGELKKELFNSSRYGSAFFYILRHACACMCTYMGAIKDAMPHTCIKRNTSTYLLLNRMHTNRGVLFNRP
jgi:hypothetical protein